MTLSASLPAGDPPNGEHCCRSWRANFSSLGMTNNSGGGAKFFKILWLIAAVMELSWRKARITCVSLLREYFQINLELVIDIVGYERAHLSGKNYVK